jgi:hypothetical protein
MLESHDYPVTVRQGAAETFLAIAERSQLEVLALAIEATGHLEVPAT